MSYKLTGLFLCALVLFVSPRADAAQLIPAGPLQADAVEFGIAVIYPAAAPTTAMADLKSVAARSWPKLAVVDKLPAKPSAMAVRGTQFADFEAPDADMLKRFGRGLSPAQIKSLEKPKHVLLLHFAFSKQHAMEGLRAAYELSAQLARQSKGLLWDDETREIFTPDKWQEQRIASWTGGVPKVSDSTVIHLYRADNGLRAVTLGMNKFGLPDIVAERNSAASANSIGNVMNLLSQALAEGAAVKSGGQFDLDVKAIAHKQLRDNTLNTQKPNALGLAKLTLVKAKRDEGDPQNRLIEIQATRHPGPDDSARQHAMLASLFGSEDGVKDVRHNDELLTASNAAKRKLPSLQADFQRGLAPGEYIQVKAPFETSSGGQEWMWVEVSEWKGSSISGVLKNVPRDVPGMKLGQAVKVSQLDVFDYTRTFPNGREEGNTTGRIIEKMQSASKR
jgi:uncharacterized protein YegJ (DUF2314 family)